MKKCLLVAYCWYEKHFPIQFGKYRIARILNRTCGPTRFTTEGVTMELSPVAVIDRKLIKGEPHDETVQRLIERELQNGGTFLDVGANIGYFSLLAARRKNVKVLAFEPSPREVKRLQRNVTLNGFGNISIFPIGLSDKEEYLSLNLGMDYNPGTNSLLSLGERAGQVRCLFTTLDRVLLRSEIADIRLCKIDVEGHEPAVLEGMRPLMGLLRKTVFVVEIVEKYLRTTGHSKADIYAYFKEYGFEPEFGIAQLDKEYDEVFRVLD
jgi:FkbM family methyltransferase